MASLKFCPQSLGIILLNSIIFFATLSTVPRHWDLAKLVSVKVANLTLKHNVLDEIA